MSDYAEYGFCDALTKPYDLERLQVALDRAFGW